MKKKTIAIALAAVVLLLGAVGGTLAWLTSTDSVTNTFTVGNVTISLDEPNFTQDIKLIPGKVIDKDPTVTVDAGSESCYVRILVTIPAAMVDLLDMSNSFAANTGWTAGSPVVGVDSTTIEFRYNNIVDASAGAVTLPAAFLTLKVDGTTTGDELAAYYALLDAQKDIVVAAQAIQSETFANADAAWTAFNS